MENPADNNKFNIENEERNTSPEKLNDYIRIGSSGGIILIAALIIAAVALIVWGFAGSIPVTITDHVAVVGSSEGTNHVVGFMDVNKNTGVLPVGAEVNIRMSDGKSVKGQISLFANSPLSNEEITETFSTVLDTEMFLTEWMLKGLIDDNTYSYMYYIDTDQDVTAYWHQIAEATIIIGEINPISLLIR